MAWLTSYAATVRICLAILVTLVACQDRGIEQMTEIKADVCACKTAGCAEQAMKRVPREPIKRSARSTRSQTLAREMIGCLAKLQAAERPSTDPDAEGSAAEPGAGSAAASSPAAGSAAPSTTK